jgi:hypothetical protein
MANNQMIPFVDTQTIIPATAGTGSFVYNLQGIDRASIQLNSTFSIGGSTGVVTLQISNDGVHYVGFSVAKTVTLTGGTTDSALFELGTIDYVFLKVSSAAPSAGTLALQGVLYGTGDMEIGQ